MKSLSVSVGMSVYNNARYLEAQLDSVLAQTVLPDEIVICDDCSTDPKVKELLVAFESACPVECRIYYNEENLYIPKNIEKTIALCNGDIIIRCDSDDIWEPTKIERIKQAFYEDEFVVYVFHDSAVIDQDSNLIGNSWIKQQNFLKQMRLDTDGFLVNVIEKTLYPFGMSIAFRRSLTDHLFPFCLADDFWIALVAPLFGKVAYIDETLAQYRRHSMSASRETPHEPHGNKLSNICNTIHQMKSVPKAKYFHYPIHTLNGFCIYQERFSAMLSPTVSMSLQEMTSYYDGLRRAVEDSSLKGIVSLIKLYQTGLYQKFRGNVKTLIMDCIFLL